MKERRRDEKGEEKGRESKGREVMGYWDGRVATGDVKGEEGEVDKLSLN